LFWGKLAIAVFWISSRAQIKVQRLASRGKSNDPLRNEAKACRPDYKEKMPKVIVKGRTVFQPKNENVTKQNNQVEDYQTLLIQSIL
jgi:thermostable 8-oxoguanine DNA glycosylase